jgi:hypothetical protein
VEPWKQLQAQLIVTPTVAAKHVAQQQRHEQNSQLLLQQQHRIADVQLKQLQKCFPFRAQLLVSGLKLQRSCTPSFHQHRCVMQLAQQRGLVVSSTCMLAG